MKPMTRWVTSLKEETQLPKGLPLSPATRMPQPKNRAITMICSMELLASGAMALLGKMLTMVSIRFAVFAS